jgi:hypothetical protein
MDNEIIQIFVESLRDVHAFPVYNFENINLSNINLDIPSQFVVIRHGPSDFDFRYQ